MTTVEEVLAKGQSDIETYIQTLSATEAVWLAGSTAHAVTGLTTNPFVNPVQLRVTCAVYGELMRQLLKHAVMASEHERPARHVVDGWNEVTARIFAEVNEAYQNGGI